ncbi:MAG: LON peptidase substrate-binding domain-containing protein [Patescibacteria group bacterium]|nr:LON peptidase substrate-binding domain-containing protein [Patescibacteria group bacterium]
MFEKLPFSHSEFTGRVRVFPLPNLVLFPHVMQPLHIFEPRYRSLMQDALRSDRLITLATLAPGWERDYEGRPPLYPTACLGRITTYHRLEDGTYNLLLSGISRVRLLRELPPNRKFREAEGELCADIYAEDPEADHAVLKDRLRDGFLRVIPMVQEAQEQLDQLLTGDLALGVLTDIIGYMLSVSLAKKQALLAELNVVRRAEMVLEHLALAATVPTGPLHLDATPFPPQFSLN